MRLRLRAPLVFDRRRNGYFYSDTTYRLSYLTLTEGELVALFLAERVLRQYRGTPYGPDLARAFQKITEGLTDRITIDLGHLDATHSFRTTAPAPFDPAIFRALTTAVAGRRRVVLDYWTASRDDRTRRAVDPYHLACVNGQWYVIGHCHVRDDVLIFAPGRILSLEPTETTFDLPADFRVDAYLSRSFAVLRGGADEVHRVRLRFTGEAVKYVRERTWHPSQVLEPDGPDGLLVSLELGHLREIERFALSWGADCEVLEPPELRERMACVLSEAAGHYRTAD
jgi:predicted DNA-binding transcriptional regulator YafY